MNKSAGVIMGFLVLVTALFCITAGTAVGNRSLGDLPFSPSVSDEELQREALKCISNYIEVDVEMLLHRIGYNPPIEIAELRRLPILTRIEMGYASAVSADPRQGPGYLAQLSSALAKIRRSANFDRALKPFLDQTASKPLKFDYTQTTLPKSYKLPSSHEKAIRAIARYCSRGPMGSNYFIMVRYFGLSLEEANEIDRASGSCEDKFLTALSKVDVQQRKYVIRSLTAEIVQHYASAKKEEALAPFIPPTTRKVSSPRVRKPSRQHPNKYKIKLIKKVKRARGRR